uniref:hypothetical protein n=1 Tax=Microbacterium gubbeenense TaxID=159896 RepID=UPI00146E6846
VSQAPHLCPARGRFRAAAAAERVAIGDAALQGRASVHEREARDGEAVVVEGGEHSQIGVAEGSVVHVEVFRMVSLGTSILGRPRPLSRDRHAHVLPDGHYTLKCEEPLDDAVVKLKALAEFAKEFGSEFHRIEAVAQVGNTMKVLDMTMPTVRDSILHDDKPAIDFYKFDIAIEYDA